ncbi:MAG: MBL fold metallo-hydrolase [Holdemanella sp.]|nr:MBL fold metallo-hydrolase [Holdemanella sp.]
MEVTYFPLGPIQANCYILKENGHALIIDPGYRFDADKEFENYIVDGILLTHCHFDHIGGVDFLVKKYNCPVYIHEIEKDNLKDPALNGSSNFGMYSKQISEITPIQEGFLQVGNFSIEVIHCPGHSKGSCVFKIEDALFTGDVLFKESIGRTDLMGGSYKEMEQSLLKFKQMDKNYLVFPGHGPYTTLEEELKYNPYL